MAEPDGNGTGGLPRAAAVVKESADLKEVGVSGLRQSYGQVREEFLPELTGRNGRKVFREMRENDPTVGAIGFAIDMRIRQVTWDVAAASDAPRARQEAEYIDGCLGDMSRTWPSTISEIMSMLWYGWSYFEILYKIRESSETEDPTRRSQFSDRRWGWRKFAPRAQDTLYRWEFDETGGGISAMVQMVDGKEIPLPIQKSLLFRTASEKDSPEGRSILRTAYRPWYFKKKIEETEGIGIERDLAGLPVAWIPPEFLADDATPEQKAVAEAFKKVVADVRRDAQEGILMPLQYNDKGHKLYDFTLLSTAGQRQFDTNAIVGRYRVDIALSVLADWLLLGHERIGTQALATSKVNVFSLGLDAWLDEIAAVFNTYAIPRLMRLNGVPQEYWPHLTHETAGQIDLEMIAKIIDALSGAGAPIFGDEVSGEQLLNHILRVAGLPEIVVANVKPSPAL